MRPTFTILLCTIGRPTLARTLASVRSQDLRPGDQVLCVVDGVSPEAKQMFREAQLPGRVIELPEGPHGDWGHTPRNKTMHHAVWDHTTHLHHLDDDDTYAPGALATMRAAVAQAPSVPHLFRMISRGKPPWPEREEVRVGNLGTPMIVHPARWGRYGLWRPQYGGDGWFIKETCSLFEAGPVWHRDVIVRVRH